jgi:hypothetical protein
MAAYGALDTAEIRALTSTGNIREDLMREVWDVSRVPLPFQDRIGTGRCTSNIHEWTIDKLGVAAANAFVENSSIPTSGTASAPTDIGNSATQANVIRARNHCQISAKVVTVSKRAQTVQTTGNTASLAYQIMQRQRELRQDMEFILLSNTASLAGNATTTAPLLGGYMSWVEDKSNPTQNLFVSAAATPSADGGYDQSTLLTVAAASTATPAAISEADLRDVIEAIYNGGAEATTAMCRPALKRIISQYMYTSSARIAQLTSEVGQATSGQDVARGAVSIFISDYGVVELVPNRFMPYQASTTHDVVAVFDPAYLSVDYLSDVTVQEAPIAGLMDQRLMFADYTLRVSSDQAVGLIADISPTGAMTAT